MTFWSMATIEFDPIAEYDTSFWPSQYGATELGPLDQPGIPGLSPGLMQYWLVRS